MSDRDNGSWLLLLAVFLLVWGLSLGSKGPTQVVVPSLVEEPKAPTMENRMAAAGIACPACLDIPDGLERIRKTVLLEGSTISTPTKEYLEYLAALCNSARFTDIGKVECNRALAELEKARDANETLMSPIYGHPPFTEDQAGFLRWSSSWVESHLAAFEYNWVGTKKDRYLREQCGT